MERVGRGNEVVVVVVIVGEESRVGVSGLRKSRSLEGLGGLCSKARIQTVDAI